MKKSFSTILLMAALVVASAASAQDLEARLPAARKALRRKKAVGWLTR